MAASKKRGGGPDVRAEIVTWKPKNSKEVICEAEGQIFRIYFDKVFNNPEVSCYNNFYVKKTSFEKHLAKNAQYINYFINKYDHENELVFAYLKLKTAIDKYKMFDATNPHALIDLIYEFIFTETMQEKIKALVEKNYLDDIERSSGKGYKQDEKDYLESLEFTNEHMKIQLAIAMGMKIICPVMYHYFTVNQLKPKSLPCRNDVGIVYDFYYPLFKMFQGNTDMINKLFVYVKWKVIDVKYHNERIFNQRAIFGDDYVLLIEYMLKKEIISENMVKYRFNEEWDAKANRYKESPIGMQKTILKWQTWYYLKGAFEKTLTEMSNTRGSDGLSASDKMEMNMSKLDQGMLDMAVINMNMTVERLLKENHIPELEGELKYLKDHLCPSDIQVHMVRSIFARFFMSYRDELLLPRKEYNTLLLLLKKKLLLDTGYEDGEYGEYSVLPYILTGNIEGKVSKRLIQSRALMARLDENPNYIWLVTYKYKELESRKPGYIKEIISMFINTRFTYVCYERPDLLGKPIESPPEKICDELLLFLKEI